MYRVVINFGAPLKNVADQVVPVRYVHLGRIRDQLHVVLDRQNYLLVGEEDINPIGYQLLRAGGSSLPGRCWTLELTLMPALVVGSVFGPLEQQPC